MKKDKEGLDNRFNNYFGMASGFPIFDSLILHKIIK